MIYNKFEGIKDYHAGSDVCDFVNMIPLGESCIDVQGQRVIGGVPAQYADTGDARGFFKASDGCIYVATDNRITRMRNTDVGWTYEALRWYGAGGAYSTDVLRNTAGKVTFCESSTKPSVIYACDSQYIYYFRPDSLECKMLWSPNMDGASPEWDPSADFRSWLNATDNSPARASAINSASRVDSICWFNNRLVACDITNNTVWLTSTNPEQFIVEENPHNPFSTDDYQLWQNYVTSNNNSDILQDVVAFSGNLYLLNKHTIEVWSRTGEEFNPIQSATNCTIYHGGRCPKIINGILFVIASDDSGNEYLGVVNGTNFEKVCNDEMAKRFSASGILDLQSLTMRGMTHIFVRTSPEEGYCYTPKGFWWHWMSTDSGDASIIGDCGDYLVTKRGWIAEFTDDTRRSSAGNPINRYIRGCFAMYSQRKIFRSFEVVCDTGVVKRTDNTRSVYDTDIYIAVSNDRGLTWSNRKTRKLGDIGNYRKHIMYRALGNGYSFLAEYGTSADYQFQVYGVESINE